MPNEEELMALVAVEPQTMDEAIAAVESEEADALAAALAAAEEMYSE